MAEDEGPVPESLLPYDDWTQEALLHVVIRALSHVAQEGLPGGHHFFLTFKTGYPGVIIPDRLRAQYPDEMTIVLQHQFTNLTMDERTKVVSVGLSFSGIPSNLVIPLAAMTAFADPEVRFGLSFDVAMPDAGQNWQQDGAAPGILDTERKNAGRPELVREEAPRPDVPAEIVSLDAFRRRPKE